MEQPLINRLATQIVQESSLALVVADVVKVLHAKMNPPRGLLTRKRGPSVEECAAALTQALLVEMLPKSVPT